MMNEEHIAPRVLVVQPEGVAPLELLRNPLVKAGVDLVTVRPDVGEPLPDGVYDGLIVLGGPMGSDDDTDFPWLADVRALLRKAVIDSTPTLGICLGAQMLASACNGNVARGSRGVEAGAPSIFLRPEASTDQLLGNLAPVFPAAQLHQDVIVELPPGAVWLGSSLLYPNQAFRLGALAWGLQFHPEVSERVYDSWVPQFDHRDTDTVQRVRDGRTALRAHRGALKALATHLGERFAGIVHRQASRTHVRPPAVDAGGRT